MESKQYGVDDARGKRIAKKGKVMKSFLEEQWYSIFKQYIENLIYYNNFFFVLKEGWKRWKMEQQKFARR